MLGHEMGHHVGDHFEDDQQNVAMGALIGALFGAALLHGAGGYSYNSPSYAADLITDFSNIGATAGLHAFSQEQEFEADYIAAHYLHEAGYDLVGADRALMAMEYDDYSEDIRNGKRYGFRSHPEWPDRLASFRVVSKKLMLPALDQALTDSTETLPGMVFDSSGASFTGEWGVATRNGVHAAMIESPDYRQSLSIVKDTNCDFHLEYIEYPDELFVASTWHTGDPVNAVSRSATGKTTYLNLEARHAMAAENRAINYSSTISGLRLRQLLESEVPYAIEVAQTPDLVEISFSDTGLQDVLSRLSCSARVHNDDG